MTAEATPCLLRGSDATIAVVAGAPARAMPAPNGQEAGEEVRVGRTDLEGREDDEAERHQRQARRTGDTDAEPRRDRGSLARERDDDESHRHERAGRLQRRVAHHELEVREREEEEAEGREELDGHGEGSGGEAAPGEVPRVEHRLAAAQLPEHERQ